MDQNYETERRLKSIEDDKEMEYIRFDGDKLMEAVMAYNNLGDPDTLKSTITKRLGE